MTTLTFELFYRFVQPEKWMYETRTIELLKQRNMAFRSLFYLLVITILMLSCKKEVYTINEEVSIGFNSSIFIETMNSDQLEIGYVELLNESRCPPDANCVWEGFVQVKLEIDESTYYELGLGVDMVDSVVYNNHVIKLLAVEYNSDEDFGKEKKSSVLIKVD